MVTAVEPCRMLNAFSHHASGGIDDVDADIDLTLQARNEPEHRRYIRDDAVPYESDVRQNCRAKNKVAREHQYDDGKWAQEPKQGMDKSIRKAFPFHCGQDDVYDDKRDPPTQKQDADKIKKDDHHEE